MRTKLMVLSAVCLLAVTWSPAVAGNDNNSAGRSFGARLGYGVDPDQFVLGTQAVFGKMFKITRFAPSFDIGFGDDVTTYTLNGDLRIFLFTPPKASTSLYAALGPTLTYWSPKNADSDLEIGFTFTAGVRIPMGHTGFYNLEARLGAGDVPDFRLMFGVLFGGVKK